MQLRDLPSVDELAREVGDPLAVDAARVVIERAREEILAGGEPGDLAARVREELADARRPRLRGVLNATGVVDPHESRARAARGGGARARRRGRGAATRTSSTTWAPASAARGRITARTSCAA